MAFRKRMISQKIYIFKDFLQNNDYYSGGIRSISAAGFGYAIVQSRRWRRFLPSNNVFISGRRIHQLSQQFHLKYFGVTVLASLFPCEKGLSLICHQDAGKKHGSLVAAPFETLN